MVNKQSRFRADWPGATAGGNTVTLFPGHYILYCSASVASIYGISALESNDFTGIISEEA
jgi:hypothetical protein